MKNPSVRKSALSHHCVITSARWFEAFGEYGCNVLLQTASMSCSVKVYEVLIVIIGVHTSDWWELRRGACLIWVYIKRISI